jgi:hypothetical protein
VFERLTATGAVVKGEVVDVPATAADSDSDSDNESDDDDGDDHSARGKENKDEASAALQLPQRLNSDPPVNGANLDISAMIALVSGW